MASKAAAAPLLTSWLLPALLALLFIGVAGVTFAGGFAGNAAGGFEQLVCFGGSANCATTATFGGRTATTALEPSMLRPRPSSAGGGKQLRPGLVVAVAGLPRTGSTALYNMLRILMFDRDPNLIALFVSGRAYSTGHNRTHIELCRQHGIPALVKLHEPAVLDELVRAGVVDVVLFSHRDPADMLCSQARFSPEMLDYNPEQWVNACHRMLAQQVQLYRAVSPRRTGPGGAAPTGTEHDMAFFPADLEAEFGRLAMLLGLDQPDQATAARLVASFQRVSSVNLPASWLLPGWPHHPGTMMHAGHQGSNSTGGQQPSACAARPALQTDAICVAWQKANGSAPAAVLRDPSDGRLIPTGGGNDGHGVDLGSLAGPELW